MDLSTTWCDLPGDARGLLVRPARTAGALPGVVLVQEIWGVDAHLQDVAARLAAAGYVVLAPDLYAAGGRRPPPLTDARIDAAKRFADGLPPQSWGSLMDPAKRGAELLRLGEPERREVGETLAELFPPDRAERMRRWTGALARAAGWLRSQPACAGRKLGSLGFCMGGALAAALAAEDARLAAAVVFYGAPPAGDAVARIACPVLGLYGGDDPRLVAQLPGFEAAMRGAGRDLDLHVYPSTPHAFFNDTRPSYRVEAARDAWARALAFLARTLSPVA